MKYIYYMKSYTIPYLAMLMKERSNSIEIQSVITPRIIC